MEKQALFRRAFYSVLVFHSRHVHPLLCVPRPKNGPALPASSTTTLHPFPLRPKAHHVRHDHRSARINPVGYRFPRLAFAVWWAAIGNQFVPVIQLDWRVCVYIYVVCSVFVFMSSLLDKPKRDIWEHFVALHGVVWLSCMPTTALVGTLVH